jgi:hypothetical protein
VLSTRRLYDYPSPRTRRSILGNDGRRIASRNTMCLQRCSQCSFQKHDVEFATMVIEYLPETRCPVYNGGHRVSSRNTMCLQRWSRCSFQKHNVFTTNVLEYLPETRCSVYNDGCSVASKNTLSSLQRLS